MTHSYPPSQPAPFLWMGSSEQERQRSKNRMPHCDSPLLWITFHYRWLILPLAVVHAIVVYRRASWYISVAFAKSKKTCFVRLFFLRRRKKRHPRNRLTRRRKMKKTSNYNACYLTRHTDLLLTRTGLYLQHQVPPHDHCSRQRPLCQKEG